MWFGICCFLLPNDSIALISISSSISSCLPRYQFNNLIHFKFSVQCFQFRNPKKINRYGRSQIWGTESRENPPSKCTSCPSHAGLLIASSCPSSSALSLLSINYWVLLVLLSSLIPLNFQSNLERCLNSALEGSSNHIKVTQLVCTFSLPNLKLLYIASILSPVQRAPPLWSLLWTLQ